MISYSFHLQCDQRKQSA